MKTTILSLFFMFLVVYSSYAQTILPADKAVHCLMGEARGEGLVGMTAVGEALRNRGTFDGVYGCNASFEEPQWVWDLASQAWLDSSGSDLVNGADHWESTSFKVPYWAKDMVVTAHIGKHKFYKRR